MESGRVKAVCSISARLHSAGSAMPRTCPARCSELTDLTTYVRLLFLRWNIPCVQYTLLCAGSALGKTGRDISPSSTSTRPKVIHHRGRTRHGQQHSSSSCTSSTFGRRAARLGGNAESARPLTSNRKVWRLFSSVAERLGLYPGLGRRGSPRSGYRARERERGLAGTKSYTSDRDK